MGRNDAECGAALEQLRAVAGASLGAVAGCTATSPRAEPPARASGRSNASVADRVEALERDHVRQVVGSDGWVQCDSTIATRVGDEYYASAVCASSGEDFPAEPSVYLVGPNATTRISRYSDTKRVRVRPGGTQRPASFSPQIHLFNFRNSVSRVELTVQSGSHSIYADSVTLPKHSGVELWSVVRAPGSYDVQASTNGATLDVTAELTATDDRPLVVVVRPNGGLLGFRFAYPCVPSPVDGSCAE